MKTIEVSETTVSLAQSAREIGQEPVILTDSGVPIAALMPIEEVDLESLALGSNPQFQEMIEQSRAQHRAGSSLTPEQVRQALGLK